MLLKEYFSTHQMMQRRDFQSLCGMVRSTAMIHIRRICQEGKLQNLGLRNQPIYVPVPGFYGTSRDQPTLR
ncbi:DNA-binding protein [Bacteroides thetaiotaomicron]|nr:DNA-binding protein [Bacteroides thetaiotaomicron]